MDKIKSYFIGGVALALVLAGVWIGWKVKPTPKPIITERIVHDTLFIAKTIKGQTLIIHKSDTIKVLYEDSVKIASYEAIIEQLADQQGNQPTEENKPCGGAVVKDKAYLRAGLGISSDISKTPEIVPEVGVLVLDHLTAKYGYDFYNKKHKVGMGWMF